MRLRIRAASIGLALLAAAFLATAAQLGPADARTTHRPAPEFVDGRVVVGFVPGTRDGVQGALFASLGARLERVIGRGAHVISVPLGSVETTIATLRRDPRVRYAEPDYVYHLTDLPDDPSFGQEWGLENTGQAVNGTAGTPGADVDAPAAWDFSVGSSSVAVAVVDTGIDYRHPDLAANVWTNPGGVAGCGAGTHGYNAIDGTCSPLDDNNHGTHVAGTIGAVGDNNRGVVGVNWTTSLIGVKTFSASGSATEMAIVQGLQWVLDARAAGVNVRAINASWGGWDFSQATLDVIEDLAAQDVLFISAAGNSGLPHSIFPFYPCDYAVETIICVGASDQDDDLAYFSDWGTSSVDLAAPGTNVLSTVRNNRYAYLSGTSMATPHVTGAAALVLALGDRSAAAVKADILAGVDVLPSLKGLVGTSGRLDLARALQLAVAPGPPELSGTAGDTLVDLAWTAPDPGISPITGYRVYRGATSGGESLLVELGDVPAYQDPGLSNGTTYYYQVAALNASGEGPRSNELALRPSTPPSSPDAPTLSGAAGDARAVLCWSAPPDGGSPITGYRLYRSGSGSEIALDVGLVTSYGDSGAANGATYGYEVTAVNAVGEGPRSSLVAVAPPGVPPTIASFAPSIATGGTTITIQGADLPACGTSVLFGTQLGSVQSGDGATLLATSPSQGGSGPLTITTAAGQVTSGADFYAVPAGSSANEVAFTNRMTFGGSQLVSLPDPGTLALVLFDGVAGQRVSMSVGSVTISSSDVSILNPDGTTLAAATVGTSGRFFDAMTLAQTGTYTIVANPRNSYTGSITVQLYEVPPDAVVGATIGGPAVTVTTTVPGQNATVTFSGTAEQRVSVAFSNKTFSTTTYGSLLNPDGSSLRGGGTIGSGTFWDTLTLPQTGTYTLFVNPSGAGTGSITVRLYDVPPDATASLTPGGPATTLTTTTPGQNGQLTFTGTAGSTYSLVVSNVSITQMDVTIRNPDGTTLVPATLVGTSGKTIAFSAAMTGTYTIAVNPRGSYLGSATFRL